MILGSAVFGILFIFIFFFLAASTISLFKKDDEIFYEPEVSVIIPCYNEEKNIVKCLDAIYSSDYPKKKLEIIVVDDGSRDNTCNILKEYSKTKPIIIIKGSHEGKSASLNRGVKRASNKIIFAVDADALLEKTTMRKMVQPFRDSEVGATNGSCIVRNKNSLLGMFQNIEYHYNNLIRRSFSMLFRNGIWFFGAFACYRKKILEKIGYFKKDSLTEDTDIALEIYSAGYRVLNVHNALGYVLAPSTFKGFYEQRSRWWIGVLQSLKKNKRLFSPGSCPSILFLFISQYWWSFYAIVSLPLIIYQYNYWMPASSVYELSAYTFRWLSAAGPLYVIYKVPEWGISLYSIFGVLAGLISMLLIVKAMYIFKEKLSLKSIIAIMFYFPYTIVLNSIILISLIKAMLLKQKYFKY